MIVKKNRGVEFWRKKRERRARVKGFYYKGLITSTAYETFLREFLMQCYYCCTFFEKKGEKAKKVNEE